MFILVTGGSASGKSAYGERLLMECPEEKKAYIATMQKDGPESMQRIERHRNLRAGKNFYTIEQTHKILDAGKQMQEGSWSAILECLSNLAANEMFSADGEKRESRAIEEEIITQIEALYHRLNTLIIITDNVFEDGVSYDASVMEYIRLLGRLNRRLAERADQVIEVVAGIPLLLKERKEP